ncbi:MAG: aminotransferase class V-fold PLP-dependent enzyme [Dehalococcoidia bacterium]|nr:aminotransferase class V-fold PLP-dependent enzyme [Dehalococcoidia bacterium]
MSPPPRPPVVAGGVRETVYVPRRTRDTPASCGDRGGYRMARPGRTMGRPMAEDPHAARWAHLREITPVTRRFTYLNAGWSGPLSLPVVEAMKRRIDLEATYGPVAKVANEDKTAIVARLREASARMLGADADEIAITGNTTEGVNIAVNGVALKPGDRVVTTSVEHSSGMVPAYWTRRKYGTEVAIVPIAVDDGPGAILERFDEALSPAASLVILSGISYSTGGLLPLAEITRLAHARGATVVVDGAQTAGHLPIDAHALGIDAYAVPSHKWLCGPDGLGMLYVRRDRIADLDPVKVSGHAAASWDFAGHFEAEREKVTKFELTTTSTPLMAGTLAAVEQYLASGPAAVWDRVRALSRYAEARFAPLRGVRVSGAAGEATRSGLFLFAVEGVDPAHLVDYLQGDGGVIARSVREMGSVRLSLHVYNTEGEVDRVAELVERAVAQGVPERYRGQARAVEA